MSNTVSNTSIIQTINTIVESRISENITKTSDVVVLEKVTAGSGLTPVNLGQLSY